MAACERFCFSTMRALLTLYLVKALGKGEAEAFSIYGAFNALMYVSPAIGGQMGDRLLGYRRAVILGGVMMAVGTMLVGFGHEDSMFLGMGVIIVGNGYFKANISTLLGKLYETSGARRDAGFTIFYVGMNLGAVAATAFGAPAGEALSVGGLGRVGYLIGFIFASLAMVVGVLVFMNGRTQLKGRGEPPDIDSLTAPWSMWVLGCSRQTVAIVVSLGIVPLLYVLLRSRYGVDALVAIALLLVLGRLFWVAVKSHDRIQRDRMSVLLILMGFNVVFWACFEQAGSSLTMFADRHVDRSLLGFEMPTSQAQAFNPIFVCLLGLVFSLAWGRLERRGTYLNVPMKFGLGLLQLGVGYLVLRIGAPVACVDDKLSLVTLVIMYMFHTTGELFLSPIGLSMITKLAPERMTGQVMGAWFLSFALANTVGASIAQIVGVAEPGAGHITPVVSAPRDTMDLANTPLLQLLQSGRGLLSQMFWLVESPSTTNSLQSYLHAYTVMGCFACGIGLLLMLLSQSLHRKMHGIC